MESTVGIKDFLYKDFCASGTFSRRQRQVVYRLIRGRSWSTWHGQGTLSVLIIQG